MSAPRRAPAFGAAVAVALVPLLAGCGLGDRERHTDAITASVDRAVDAGSATGTLTVSMRVAEVPPVAGGLAGGSAGAGFDPAAMGSTPEVALGVAIDFRRSRALLASERPFEVFDDLDLYGVRHAASERDARPWVKLDVDELEDGTGGLDDQQDPPVLVVNAISPVVLVDLVAGALTGSVERAGTEDVDGVATTRYEANFDLDKVLHDTRRDAYGEDRREAVERLFDLLAVKGTVHAGDVWIDGDGRPRRFALRLEVEPRRKLVFEVGLRLDLTAFGEPVNIEPPSPAELLEVDSLLGFLRAVVPTGAGGS